MPCWELQSWKSHKDSAVVWKNISQVRTGWLAYCWSSSKPFMMNSLERNWKILGGSSRHAPASCQLCCKVPGRHHSAQSALEFSKAGGGFYWINVVPAGAVIACCWETTSYLLRFYQPSHFYAEFLLVLFLGDCFVLLNSWSVPLLSVPPSTLGKKSEGGIIRRGFTQCESSLSPFEFAGVSYKGLSENFWTCITPFPLLFLWQ